MNELALRKEVLGRTGLRQHPFLSQQKVQKAAVLVQESIRNSEDGSWAFEEGAEIDGPLGGLADGEKALCSQSSDCEVEQSFQEPASQSAERKSPEEKDSVGVGRRAHPGSLGEPRSQSEVSGDVKMFGLEGEDVYSLCLQRPHHAKGLEADVAKQGGRGGLK